MGYRIVYGKDKRRFSIKYKPLLVIGAICAAALLLSYFARSIRLPEAALENMVEAVRSGESLTDAITAFCREIIVNAQNFC